MALLAGSHLPRDRVVIYPVLKFLHVLGVILLVGNVTVTAVWKVFADRTHNAVVVAFGQRLVTITDWFLTGVRDRAAW